MASTTQMKTLTSRESLLEMIKAFQISRIILTGFELEVFSILGGKKLTGAQIAKSARADSRAMDRLLNSLCALGLLTKKKGHFANTSFSRKYLIKGHPDFLAGIEHSMNLWKRWSTLTQAVIHGKTVIDRKASERKGKSPWKW